MSDNPSAFLIKVSDGAELPSYTTVAGMHQVSREDGLIEGVGPFTGLKAHGIIYAAAASGEPIDLELSFASGEQVRGRYIVGKCQPRSESITETNYRVELSAVKAPADAMLAARTGDA